MAKLTGLSDSVLTRSGHMEVYEETFESLTFKLKKIDEKKAAEKPEIPEGTDDDDALDMLAGSMETGEPEQGRYLVTSGDSLFNCLTFHNMFTEQGVPGGLGP